MKQRYRFEVTYDGTDYQGWQRQPNGPTVQEELEKVLSMVLQEPIVVNGSGRTDAGVHAHGQVAHFDTTAQVDTWRLQHSLNNVLSRAIRVTNLRQAEEGFHSRYNACGKEYHYRICMDEVQSPFERRYQYHLRRPTSVAVLQEAAQRFVGTHDFTSFANEPGQGAVSKNPVRTLYRVDVVQEAGGVRIEFEGNGFLYKMVRIIVGTLLDIAGGKRQLSDLDAIFEAKDRRRASRPAPAHGLSLIRVHYEE